MKRIPRIAVLIAAALLAFSCKTDSSISQEVDYQLSYSVGDQSFEMMEVPSGNFSMHVSADNRRLVTGGIIHEVALDGFVISKEPVSTALWTAVMGKDPSSAKDPSAPVDMVSYDEALKFIAKLGKLTGKTFFLPTEAQWEYACRQTGSRGFTKVAEWCRDSYEEVPSGATKTDYFVPLSLAINPEGPKEVSRKVVRTVLERMPLDRHTRKLKVGFRVAQLSGDKLPESFLSALDGPAMDREKTDFGEGRAETVQVGPVAVRMVKVKGGTFSMGFNELYDAPYMNFKVNDNEIPPHDVTVDDFQIAECEVTVELWKAVMGSVPYLNDTTLANRPVRNVSWYNCQTFIRKLNEMTGRKFRLPTEAEWEYAARGGQLSRHTGFAGGNDMKSVMWYYDNSGTNPKDVKPQAVKTMKPNELGLYDMSGNVWEWVFDRAAPYGNAPLDNPAGPAEGSSRILKGGSFSSEWVACRISNRMFMPAKNTKGTFGFRLAI